MCNINKTINNYIKIKGLSYELEKVYYADKYYKFLGALLVPSLIFIFRLYYIIPLLQFAIMSFIFLAFFIAFTSQIVIDFVFNFVEFINKVKEVLIDPCF